MNVGEEEVVDGIAILCGRGDLPRILAEHCKTAGLNYQVVEFETSPVNWKASHPNLCSKLEQPGVLFDNLARLSCTHIVLAGAMERTQFDAGLLDDKGFELAHILAESSKAGDDRTLSSIVRFLEANSFNVLGAHEVLTELIPKPGILTASKPSEQDEADAARAAEITTALGSIDVGQGAVVAQGICLATESIQGTDIMLEFVCNNSVGYLPDPKGAKGLLFKRSKPDQDLRVDMATIGPDTVRNAHNAGLAGVVIQSEKVMLLHQQEAVDLADELGLFLWVRPEN